MRSWTVDIERQRSKLQVAGLLWKATMIGCESSGNCAAGLDFGPSCPTRLRFRSGMSMKNICRECVRSTVGRAIFASNPTFRVQSRSFSRRPCSRDHRCLQLLTEATRNSVDRVRRRCISSMSQCEQRPGERNIVPHGAVHIRVNGFTQSTSLG